MLDEAEIYFLNKLLRKLFFKDEVFRCRDVNSMVECLLSTCEILDQSPVPQGKETETERHRERGVLLHCLG